MKKILALMLMLMTCIGLHAQSLETNAEFPTGYMESCYYNGTNTIKSIDGVLYMIYDDMPVVLLRYPASNPRTEYEVPSTVRRIANNAFQGTKYLKTLKLHNEVTFGRFIYIVIGETAFNDSSIENFIVVENNKQTPATSVAEPKAATEGEHREVGRYDLGGRRTTDNSSSQGVQIVKYEDGTATKVLK